MGLRVRIGSAFVAATLAFVVVGTSTAHALLSKVAYKCQTTIAKEGAKYFNGKLKLIQKCKNSNVQSPGSCTAPDPTALGKLVTKLNSGLSKGCSADGADADNLARLGFPGPCADLTGTPFNLGDLQACILASHDKALDGLCIGGSNVGQACLVVGDCPDSGPGTACRGLVDIEYDPSVPGPLADTALKCQKEVAKNTAKFSAALLKNVQKCRNDLLNCKFAVDEFGNDIEVCKKTGLSPTVCATNDPKTAAAITKAKDKALAAIAAKCSTPADLTLLKICEPDAGDGATAASCEVQSHQDYIDNPNPAGFSDLIDFQYAQRGTCGDNRRNSPSEECDGVDDSSCPGQCGDSVGFFPCLCLDIPRTRVIEHANSDLDNGWSGQSHDSGIVEGGGYVTDLWDCDGPLGSDPICNVGPTCLISGLPCNPSRDATGAAANADSICSAPGDTCRKTAGGSTGPHCEIDFKKRCRFNNDTGLDRGDCTNPGDRCVKLPHGSPLPLSSGGVAVCIINEFTEDVTGTTNLATGDGSIRLRQNSSTYQGGDTKQPCPVCGGFCAGTPGTSGPGQRGLCDGDEDCPGSTCILDKICSWGGNVDGPCRHTPPGGGGTEFFGNPSIDCPIGENQKFGTINILFNPATTGTTTLTANLPCNSPGFNDMRCTAGPNLHHICTNSSECPGGACNRQCFCPLGGSPNTRPTGCDAACFGGDDDAAPCITDAECAITGAPGICHPGDCRENSPPFGPDTDSAQEGLCTVGPDDRRCSGQAFKPCGQGLTQADQDKNCRPPSAGGNCPYCDPLETCVSVRRNCFVPPTIEREGSTAGYVPVTNQERVTAAIFCISASGSSSVDGVAGLPGPGAITQPAKTVETGF